MADLERQTFAGYEIIGELGRGGMGAVYKARQPVLNRLVALKIMATELAADPDFVARFKREANAAAALNHENIVQVFSAGEFEKTHFIAMEFVEGTTLRHHIESRGRLDPREAVAVTVLVAQALQYAWNKGRIIHRDIKPENIFLSNAGEVKVGDLGLAKTVGGGTTSLTQTGMMMGSPHYISPEQARGLSDIDFRADIYSLGCTLYHMLTGRPPYAGTDPLVVINKHVNEPPPAIFKVWPTCPIPLALLVGKMLAKQRHERPTSYEDLIEQLRELHEKLKLVATVAPVSASEPTQVLPTPAPEPPAPKPVVAKTPVPAPKASEAKSVIRDWRFVVSAVAAVALVAGATWWFAGRAGERAGGTKQLDLGGGVTVELVYIPPGEFLLGSTKEEQAWAVAKGLKEVDVKHEGEAPRKAAVRHGFWMGRTEVTVGQWRQFVDATGYKTDAEKKGEVGFTYDRRKHAWERNVKGASWRDPGFDQTDSHPVGCVSWNDAAAFCAWLTEREQKAGRLPPDWQVRLPTEAEWEYACRAGTRTKFWWGESAEDGKDRMNCGGMSKAFQFTSPVDHYGARGRNGFGLADMLGNVQEFCLDDWDATGAHEEVYKGGPLSVVRGGTFANSITCARCASREDYYPSLSNSRGGFRVSVGMDAPGSAAAAPKEGRIFAPAETRVSALTTNPKVGEVFTLPLGGNVTMDLMGIPPGEFLLGSTKEEQAWAVANGAREQDVKREGEAPRKAAIKQGFWMGRTEVTVGQWKQFVKETGYVTDGEKKGESYVYQGASTPFAPMKGKSWRDPNFGFEPQDDHPVSCISWNDAKAFCEWLNECERKAGRLARNYVARLPTEVEWEYACRGGRPTKFWWGDAREDSKGRLNWLGKGDTFEFVAPVDSFGALGRNQFGLADMLGNVHEWCLDEDDARQAHEDSWTGNHGARVLRGGAFYDNPARCRCAYRYSYSPYHSLSGLGFRVVVGVDLSGARSSTPSTSSTAEKEGGILAPAETRVSALTANPKVGEVFTLPVGGNVTMELMGIPPGEFMLGSTKEEQAWAVASGGKKELVQVEGETPRKAAIKQGFWMGRTEVTIGQWKLFVAATGYKTEAERKGYVDLAPRKGLPAGRADGLSWRDPGFGSAPEDNHPVCCVSWNDAVAFCAWANEREQKAGRLPRGWAVRLPTEAEWEYACRGGNQTKWWWGDTKEDGKGRLNWFRKDDGFEFTSPVDHYGAKGRNGFGLADMLGNVREKCLDDFDASGAHEELYKGGPARVFRGGAFIHSPVYTRCACRDAYLPGYSDFCGGFRVAVGIDVSGARTGAAATPPAADDALTKEVAALPAEQQVARVVARLKELNPGYDGKDLGKGRRRDVEAIRPIKTLRQINGLPPEEFWKQAEVVEVPKL